MDEKLNKKCMRKILPSWLDWNMVFHPSNAKFWGWSSSLSWDFCESEGCSCCWVESGRMVNTKKKSMMKRELVIKAVCVSSMYLLNIPPIAGPIMNPTAIKLDNIPILDVLSDMMEISLTYALTSEKSHYIKAKKKKRISKCLDQSIHLLGPHFCFPLFLFWEY